MNIIDAWMNYSKFHMRILKAMNHTLMEEYQLGMNDFYLLYFLGEADEGELQQSQLQTLMELSPSALSRMIVRLIKYKQLNIIEKHSLDHDKRGYAIRLTKTGKELLNQLHSTLEQKLNHSLTEEDLAHVLSLSKP